MRALGRQAEDVGGELHRRVALRAAAGHAQAHDRRARTLLDALLALAQGIGQALEDGPVDVRPVCTSPKPIIAPLASSPGSRIPGDQ